MNLARIIWDQVRMVNRLPGAFAIYRHTIHWFYRDGSTVRLRRGPAAGLLWRHYRDYQPWMAMGVYEPQVAEFINSQLAPGDVFYDIGANAGYFSLIAARQVGEQGRVIAFDPHPRNCATIREQWQVNNLHAHCEAVPLAVADYSGKARFVLTTINANCHLQNVDAPHINADGEAVDVDVVTLDAFVADHPHPTLVKMDIEGAEVSALEGARGLLRCDKPPRMLVSTHSDRLERESREILEHHGYRVEKVDRFDQMLVASPVAQ
jgi:FkbM family methyltransferase